MFKVFVSASNKAGELEVADHLRFSAVPRIGEHIIVTEHTRELVIEVTGVTHIAETNVEVMPPVSPININGKVVDIHVNH